MKPPIGFVYGNCVFADGLDDGWAAFAVQIESYEWLSRGRQARAVPGAARRAGGARGGRADPARGRRWELGRYARELESGCASADEAPVRMIRQRTCARRTRVTWRSTKRHLSEIGAARPAVFLLVSLRDPERDVAAYVSRAAERHPREWWEGLRRAFSVRDRRC